MHLKVSEARNKVLTLEFIQDIFLSPSLSIYLYVYLLYLWKKYNQNTYVQQYLTGHVNLDHLTLHQLPAPKTTTKV